MERKIVLVAGMHRCGTSALTRVLNLLGASLPEPILPASVDNELGFWEPVQAITMNDRALADAGTSVNSVLPFSAPPLDDRKRAAFVGDITEWLDGVARPGELTVVKDPRIAILAPLWREAVEGLGLPARFVICWRHPWEVARSLVTRQLAHFPDELWPEDRAVLLWLKHQLLVEQASRGALRSFVFYPALVENWRGQIDRVATQLGLETELRGDHGADEIASFLTADAHRWRMPQDVRDDGTLADKVVAVLNARTDDPSGGHSEFDALAGALTSAFTVLGGYMKALEDRVGDDAAAMEAAGDARAIHASLRLATEAIARRSEERALYASDAPAGSADIAEWRAMHEGLRLAHADALAELRWIRVAVSGLRAAAAEADAAQERYKRSLSAADYRVRTERGAAAARFDSEKRQWAHALRLERKSSAEQLAVERAAADDRSARERAEADDRLVLERAGAEDRLARERAAATERLDRLEAERAAATERLDLIRAEMRQEVRRRIAAEADVRVLRASRSWRATAPLRFVTVRLRRLLGR